MKAAIDILPLVNADNPPRPTPPPDLVVISAGGNDALAAKGTVAPIRVDTVAHALQVLGGELRKFEARYAAGVDAVRAAFPSAHLITIIPYNAARGADDGLVGGAAQSTSSGRWSSQAELDPVQLVERTGLCLYADVIQRVTMSRAAQSAGSAGSIDLRLLFTDTADYANPIEPSAQGGRKIARAVAAAALR